MENVKRGTKYYIPGVKDAAVLNRDYTKEELKETFVCLDRRESCGNSNQHANVYTFYDRNKNATLADLPGEHMVLKQNGIWANNSRGEIVLAFSHIQNEKEEFAFTQDTTFDKAQKVIYCLYDLIEEPLVKQVIRYEYKGNQYATFGEANNEVVFDKLRHTGLFSVRQLDYIRNNIELFKSLTAKEAA